MERDEMAVYNTPHETHAIDWDASTGKDDAMAGKAGSIRR